jgi:hypothetical protein
VTRAAERPPMTDSESEEPWEDDPQGEAPDIASRQALHLAHKAAEKFPELANRYRSFAGPAVIVSGALVALAGVAVARRIRKGQRPEDILDEITSEEIEQAATVSSRQNHWWRMLARIARRRRKEADDASGAL